MVENASAGRRLVDLSDMQQKLMKIPRKMWEFWVGEEGVSVLQEVRY